jgi:putative cell wall-binding protein
MIKKKKIISLSIVILVFVTILAPVSMADTTVHYLKSLLFGSDSDNYVTSGENTNIYMRLFFDDGAPYSGNVFAYLTDPAGVTTPYDISGQEGYYEIDDITLYIPGIYKLVVKDESNSHSAQGRVIVTGDADVIINGSLVLNDSNPSHQVIATLEDSSGDVIAQDNLNIDGTAVGATNLSLITDAYGQVRFHMTPSMMGIVYFYYQGKIVGAMSVQPTYKTSSRIGETSSNNASLSVDVTKYGWVHATNVILTRDDIFVDAMAAVPLSKKIDAPILMTPSTNIDAKVLEEIKLLKAKNVYIIGGIGAVSTDVEKALTNIGITVKRVAGSDRYETAVQIANIVGSNGKVYLAYGYGEPDALAVSAFAAEQGNPILLTESTNLPPVTQAALQSLAPDNVNLLGGTGIIGSEIENLLKTQYSVERWGGKDRYGTEQIIFRNLFSGQSPLFFTSALVKTADLNKGVPYGDALVTAALAAKMGGFVVTIPPDNLPLSINTFLLYNKGYISTSTVVGNKTAITVDLEKELQTLLDH